MSLIATFTTSRGPIRIKLHAEKAPLTVANFMQYVTAGRYNQTVFHRSVSNFVIQGGGFARPGTDGIAAIEIISSLRRYHSFNSGQQHVGSDVHGIDATRSWLGRVYSSDIVLGGWTFHRSGMEYVG